MEDRIKHLSGRDIDSRAIWAIVLLAVAVLILPRLAPLSDGFLYYDDFDISPADHLPTHRPAKWAEQSFWFWIYGSEYLRSFLPKVVAFCYILLGVCAMVQVFRAWRIPSLPALIAVLLFLANPVMTDYFVWNTESPDNLAWALCLVGYLVQLRPGGYALASGIALGSLALGTYQIAVGWSAMLVLIETLLRLVRGDLHALPWIRRMVWIFCPIAFYLGYLFFVASLLLGIPTAGAGDQVRGFPGLSEIFTGPFLQQKFHAISNGYLIVVQPLLAYYFGSEAAWRAGWKFWIFIVLSVPILLCVRLPARTALVGSALFVAALLAPMSFHLVVNTPAFGWRVSLGGLLALCLWFVVFSALLLERRKLWPLAGITSAAGLAAALALVPVTVKDAENRAKGFSATKDMVRFLGAVQASSGPEWIGALPIKAQAARPGNPDASGEVMVNFHVSSCANYSAAIYLRHFGKVLRWRDVRLAPDDKVAPEARARLQRQCEVAVTQEQCGIAAIADSTSNLGAACFYGGSW